MKVTRGTKRKRVMEGKFTTVRAPWVETRWRPVQQWGAPLTLWDQRRTFTDLPHRMCLLNRSSSHLSSFLHQISADKKTLGRFCGQLGSPLGNLPEGKEFVSQGNKMLLTFHTDFSNEENGTIMFYKGFLAYYQAVGEWPLGPFFSGLRHVVWGLEKGNLESIEAGSPSFLILPLKRAFSRRGLPTWVLSPWGSSQKALEWPESGASAWFSQLSI